MGDNCSLFLSGVLSAFCSILNTASLDEIGCSKDHKFKLVEFLAF